MPQVQSKAHAYDTASAFGKNSRFMASLRFTDRSLRRVNVLNSLEHSFTKKKLDFLERDSNVQRLKYERIKNRLVDNLQKRLAYKMVLKNHSISEAKDYSQALDKKYTYTAFKGEVKNMLIHMRPERIRERKARSLIHENQNSYDNIIFQNSQKFNKLFPEKKTWLSRRARLLLEEQSKQQEAVKETTPLPTRERNARKSLATLRRRIITLDDSKPNSPLKLPKTPALSPTKTPTLSKPPSSHSRMTNKRQEISMSMMKKQKSFIDNKEMTNEDLIIRMESRMKSLQVDDTEENSETKDENNNDIETYKESETVVTFKTIDNVTANNKSKADDKTESFLPPIVKQPQPQQKANQPNLKNKTPRDAKLPVLKMSKTVKAQ
jgi:hypothetical protein